MVFFKTIKSNYKVSEVTKEAKTSNAKDNKNTVPDPCMNNRERDKHDREDSVLLPWLWAVALPVLQAGDLNRTEQITGKWVETECSLCSACPGEANRLWVTFRSIYIYTLQTY